MIYLGARLTIGKPTPVTCWALGDHVGVIDRHWCMPNMDRVCGGCLSRCLGFLVALGGDLGNHFLILFYLHFF
jgi:hypothetical protein